MKHYRRSCRTLKENKKESVAIGVFQSRGLPSLTTSNSRCRESLEIGRNGESPNQAAYILYVT